MVETCLKAPPPVFDRKSLEAQMPHAGAWNRKSQFLVGYCPRWQELGRGWLGPAQSILLTGRGSDEARRHLCEQSRVPRRHATLAPGHTPKLAASRQTSPLRLALCSSVCLALFFSTLTLPQKYYRDKGEMKIKHIRGTWWSIQKL